MNAIQAYLVALQVLVDVLSYVASVATPVFLFLVWREIRAKKISIEKITTHEPVRPTSE